MNFSANQVRQVYVAKANQASTLTNVGDIKVGKIDGSLFFQYKGEGGITRSDLIPVSNILYSKAVDASKMAVSLKDQTITLKTDYIKEGGTNLSDDVVGKDFIVRITFNKYGGMSEDNQYVKYGVVHAVKSMTVSKFYATLAVSLAKNFSREVSPLVKFQLITQGASSSPDTTTDVTGSTKLDSLTGTYKGVKVIEVEQPWSLGTFKFETLDYEITFVPVDSLEAWGELTDNEGPKVGNGKISADLEYFAMGFRGDIYRNVGWPKVIPTKYIVDSSKEYDYIDIHYYYVGDNENPQKSEKDITIMVPQGEGDAKYTAVNAIISAINTAAGSAILKALA